MEPLARHQCLIYDGSPARVLPAIAAQIKQKLRENVRCLYLNSPTMVAGIRSYLYAAGVDVAYEVARTGLVLTSDQHHLKNGHFDAAYMLGMLEDMVNQALSDKYEGLWATGDMTWELGPERKPEKLVDYEWGLEKLFQKHPTLSGICQYHADTLPREAVCRGLLAHPTLFINETLTRINPNYVGSEAPVDLAAPTPELSDTVNNLCALQLVKEL